MNHDEIRELLNAYVDGELDLLNSREIEQHLRECPDCRTSEQQIRSLHQAIITGGLTYRAPMHFRKQVRAAVRREARASNELSSRWLIFAVGAACALALFAIGVFLPMRGSVKRAIADEVVANHVRSLLAAHLVDIGSSDQHVVKPWFDGKVDFAPQVRDFSAEGFRLIGGRLDYLDGKTVIALVYQRNKHPINVFIMPAAKERDISAKAIMRRGYNLLVWSRDQMNYWAVSDLNQDELGQLVDLLNR